MVFRLYTANGNNTAADITVQYIIYHPFGRATDPLKIDRHDYRIDDPAVFEKAQDGDTGYYYFKVTLPKGKSEVSFRIRALKDSRVERRESIRVQQLSVVSGNANIIPAISYSDRWITDTPPRILISPELLPVTEGSTATYRVRLAALPTNTVTVDISGHSGSDLTLDKTRLIFTTSNWNRTQPVTVTASADADTADDTVTLTHTASGGGYGSVTEDLTVTVTDDDIPKVLVSPVKMTVKEGKAGTYRVRLATPPTMDVTITVNAENGVTVNRSGGVAGSSQTLTFTTSNWNQAQTVTVRATDDNDANDETVMIRHTSTSSDPGYNELPIDPVTVTVTDDDMPGIFITAQRVNGIHAASTGLIRAPEGETVRITVIASPTPPTDITVSLNVVDAENSDFLENTEEGNREIMILAGKRNATFDLEIIDDHIDEPDGEVTVTVADSPSTYTVRLNTVRILALDNDDPATADRPVNNEVVTPLAEFEKASAIIAEGNWTVDMALSITPAPASDITLAYSVSGTATASQDYEALSGTVAVVRGETSATIPVTLIDDLIPETSETIVLTLTDGEYYDLGTTYSTTITITDSDNKVLAEQVARLALTRLGRTVAQQTLDGISARLRDIGTDRNAGIERSTAGQALPIPVPAPELEPEDSGKEMILRHTASGGGYDSLTADVAVTIGNAPAFPVEAPETAVTEDAPDAPDAPTMTLTPGSTKPLTVKLNVADATDDKRSQTVTIKTGKTGNINEVATVNVTEDDGNYTVTLGNQPTAEVTVTVNADSGVTVNVTLNKSPDTTDTATVNDAPPSLVVAPNIDAPDSVEKTVPWPTESDDAGEPRTLTREEVVTETSFTMTQDLEADGSLTLWGRGARSDFAGRSDAVSLEGGEVTGFMLGADRTKEDWLAGLMVSQNRGEVEYRQNESDAEGKIKIDLTTLAPYARRDINERLHFWGTAGLGQGKMRLTLESGDALQSDIDWRMAAVGLDGTLLEPDSENGFGVDVTGDILWMRIASEATRQLAATSGKTTRLRFGLEGFHQRQLDSGRYLRPWFGLGLRHDGGDAETGWGLEIGGGLDWSDPMRGLGVSIKGRTLALHEDGNFRDWGFAIPVVYDPSPETETGFSAWAEPRIRGASSGGVNAFLSPGALPGLPETEGDGSWELGMSYGLPRGRGLVGSPYMTLGGRTSNSASAQARLGYRIKPDAPYTPDLTLDLWTEPGHNSASFNLGYRW